MNFDIISKNNELGCSFEARKLCGNACNTTYLREYLHHDTKMKDILYQIDGEKRMAPSGGAIQALIRDHLEQLTPSQVRVADFILEDPTSCAFMTSEQIGRRIGVSESTIIRFATMLGFRGYPEFQDSCREIIREKLSPAKKIEQSSIDNKDKEKSHWLSFEKDLGNLQYTIDANSDEDFEAAIEALLAARQIWVMGLRRSYSMAHMFGFLLNQALSNATVLGFGADEIPDQISAIHSDDVLVAISMPRYSRETVDVAKKVVELGVKVICITDTLTSPLARTSNIVFRAANEMPGFHLSNVGIVAVLNALLVGISMGAEERVKDNLSRLEQLRNAIRPNANNVV